MKILHRYLILNYIGPLIFCIVLFIMMFVFVDSLSNLDEFIKTESPFFLIVSYYAAMVPTVLAQVLPVASLMSALYFLGFWNRHNEITAMKASGISGVRIIMPLLMTGLVLSAVVFVLQEKVIPLTTVKAQNIKDSVMQGSDLGMNSQSLQNVTLLSSGNRMIYARELHLPTNTLHDIVILEHYENLGLKGKIAAQKAVYQNGWTLYNVVQYELSSQGEVTTKPAVQQQMRLDIKEMPHDFVEQYQEAQFMNYQQLKNHIKSSTLAGFRASNRLYVDLYQKLASPFMCLIIMLVGVPSALKIRRGSAMISVVIGLGIVAGYYTCIAIISALGKGGILPPIAAVVLPHGIFASIGAYLLVRYI